MGSRLCLEMDRLPNRIYTSSSPRTHLLVVMGGRRVVQANYDANILLG